MIYIDPDSIPTEAEMAKAKKAYIKEALQTHSNESVFYLDTGEFRNDLIHVLRGIESALDRISDHLQEN